MTKTFLIDLYHPAHYHLFKHAARKLETKGHHVCWVARDKDCLRALLDADGVTYKVLTSPRKGITGMARELLEHDIKVLLHARARKAEILIGTSVSITHAALLMPGTRSIVFNEDNADAVRLFSRLSYPFATTIVTPDCLKERHGSKHIVYPSYHELAYLHPDLFKPDANRLARFGVAFDRPYFIIRLVALKASHDLKQRGLPTAVAERLVAMLSRQGQVLITGESALPDALKPYQVRVPPEHMHHLMAFASLLVSDSQTMTAEAAVLGVPSVRCNTFVGRLDYLEELEHRYQLTHGFTPDRVESAVNKVEELLTMPDRGRIYQERRSRMLAEKMNLTEWITDFLDKY